MFDSFSLTPETLIKGAVAVVVLLIAIIGHEIMHGAVAYKYGDSTAKDAGRLSINPIKHIDPIGTIIVPLMLFIANSPFLFGWAKPVPVNIMRVLEKGGYNGAMAVAVAGVAYNFALAIVASIILSSMVGMEAGLVVNLLAYFLIQMVVFNVVLGVFNLLPIPPLDGSQLLSYLTLKFGIQDVARFFNKIETYGMIFLIIILVTPLKMIIFYPVNVILYLLLG